ncbi:hypothetical protein ATANTOWER_010129 [Ataeniobius toweri]|uniref:Uncharacterized protein n=1 Tax=Ataeniobius toweri TaxID=208326 RepID=A0ABU7BPP7_9TELE|nr:hypothetical protein [Ataeniobius toweri]
MWCVFLFEPVCIILTLYRLEQGLATPVLECHCLAMFGCIPAPTHLNHMAELPDLAINSSFDSSVLKQGCVAGHWHSGTGDSDNFICKALSNKVLKKLQKDKKTIKQYNAV